MIVIMIVNNNISIWIHINIVNIYIYTNMDPINNDSDNDTHNDSYPLVNCHITIERSTMFNGKKSTMNTYIYFNHHVQ